MSPLLKRQFSNPCAFFLSSLKVLSCYSCHDYFIMKIIWRNHLRMESLFSDFWPNSTNFHHLLIDDSQNNLFTLGKVLPAMVSLLTHTVIFEISSGRILGLPSVFHLYKFVINKHMFDIQNYMKEFEKQKFLESLVSFKLT